MSNLLQFWKYQGLGNDFVIVEHPITSADARALCDRKLGIGADGVLVVELNPAGEPTAATVLVWNADGSQAEICGNGLRCATWHLHRRHWANASLPHAFLVHTGAGPRRCTLLKTSASGGATVEVEMGRPQLERSAVPVTGEGTMINEPLVVEGRELRLTAVGMGNPHAVAFGDFSHQDVLTLGPRLEKHPLFPAGVNAGFARLAGPNHLRLTVWERGAGLTGACGSGACAAAVAACTTGQAAYGTSLTVEQPGGLLSIIVDEENRGVLMKGPAQHVFEGQVDLAELLGH